MKRRLLLIMAILVGLVTSCVHNGTSDGRCQPTFQSTFDDLVGWQDDSARNSPPSYRLDGGKLRIATRPATRDRVKVRTDDRFGAGRYRWRVYVPAMGRGDQASVGAFLYRDDEHEFDFEIGYGRAALRERLQAREGDLVCYCTSQGHPASSSQILIEREAWYDLTIDIVAAQDENYVVTWLVNGHAVKRLEAEFGSMVTFTAHCSVENLSFIGDHIPTQENYALFDRFEFIPPGR